MMRLFLKRTEIRLSDFDPFEIALLDQLLEGG